MLFFDLIVNNYFSASRTSSTTQLYYIITSIFDFSIHFVLLVVAVALLTMLVRGIRYAFLFVGSIAAGGVSVYLLKILFNTNRPLDGVFTAMGNSFPSGHAAISTIFFIMLIYLFAGLMKKGLIRSVFVSICVLAIIMVSFTRVYLGVHWVTDIAAGIALGSAVLFCSIRLFKRMGYEQVRL